MLAPKQSGNFRITVKKYGKFDDISRLRQLPIPRVNQVLDLLGKRHVFPLFDLVPSFNQITAHKDTVPLTASSTPTGL